MSDVKSFYGNPICDATARVVASNAQSEAEQKYTKPSTGIPTSDLDSNIQSALSKAASALQPDALNEYVQNDDVRLSDARTPVAHTHTVSEITDFPELSDVATSGSYNDLTNKPTPYDDTAVKQLIANETNRATAREDTLSSSVDVINSDITSINNNISKKVGYAEYTDSHLILYSDSTKETTIADLTIEGGSGGSGITEAKCKEIIESYGFAVADDFYTKAEIDSMISAVDTAFIVHADASTGKADKTLNEIIAASNSGKTVFCIYDEGSYVYSLFILQQALNNPVSQQAIFYTADNAYSLTINGDSKATLSALGNVARQADLAAVATSGNYEDLANLPDIPEDWIGLVYGTSTLEEVAAAWPKCYVTNYLTDTSYYVGMPMSDIGGTAYLFSLMTSSGAYVYQINEDGWKLYTYNFAVTSNLKTVAFSGSSEDATYDGTAETHTAGSVAAELASVNNKIAANDTAISSKYEKPSTGIPAEDIATGVIPTSLKSPGTLTFTGAVSETYDGSSNKTVNIPEGGSGGAGSWSRIVDLTTTEELSQIALSQGDDGESFSDYSKIAVFLFNVPVVDNTSSNQVKINFGTSTTAWSSESYTLMTLVPKYGSSGSQTGFGIFEKIDGGIVCSTSYESINGTSMRNTLISIVSTSGYKAVINTTNSTTVYDNTLSDPVFMQTEFNKIIVGAYFTCIGIGSRLIVWGYK